MSTSLKVYIALIASVLCSACQASSDSTVAGFLGAQGTESINAVAADDKGNYYVVGGIRTAKGPMMASTEDSLDVFIAKYSQFGQKQDFMVTFGGSEKDFATSIAMTPEGDIIVGGVTYSADFPVMGSTLTSHGLRSDGFVVKFSAEGNMVASRYFGGASTDVVEAVFVDAAGTVFIGGGTDSLNFPLGYTQIQETRGRSDAYIAALTPDLQTISKVKTFGGELSEKVTALEGDNKGYLLATGITASNVFSGNTVSTHPDSSPSSIDIFLSRFRSNDLNQEFAVVMGGRRSDFANAISVSAQGDVYIVGDTFSDDFPLASPLSNQLKGNRDGFILRASAANGAIISSTYFGGSASDMLSDVSIDSSGHLQLTGTTSSEDLIVDNVKLGNFQGGTRDGLFAVIDLDRGAVLSSRYIGGSLNDDVNAIVVNADNSAVIVGRTGSSDFRADINAVQSTYGGGTLDGFIIYEPALN